MMTPKVIKIYAAEIDADTHELSIVPTTAEIGTEQPVRWELYKGTPDKCGETDGVFQLIFYDPRAVGQLEINGRGRKQMPDVVTTGKELGFYHYKVIAHVDGRIYAEVGCPTMKVK